MRIKSKITTKKGAHHFLLGSALLLLLIINGCFHDDDDDSNGDYPGALLPNVVAVNTVLSGSEEVPPVITSATGEVHFQINVDTGAMSGTVTTSGLDAQMAHIHMGFAGEDGPIIITLIGDGSGGWQVPANTLLSDADLNAFQEGALYVNVHSAAYPDGELRGQLLPTGVAVFRMALEARQQVPPLTSVKSADGALTLNSNRNDITFHLNGIGIEDATGAHIHQAVAGRNGDVVIPLSKDSANPLHWFLSTTPLDATQLQQLFSTQWYVNLHTPAYPDGELRAQLVFAPYEMIMVTLTGEQEVPPVMTTHSAVAALTLNHDTKVLQLHLNALGLDDATGAHIHQGFVGVVGDVVISLNHDTVELGHWFLDPVTLSDAIYTRLRAAGLYVNVHTPTYPDGEVRGQIIPAELFLYRASK